MDLSFQDLIPKEFNFSYDTNITSDMKLDEVATAIENEPDINYFYISYNWQDVIKAITEEWDTAEQLKLSLIQIVPQGICVAMYQY